MKTGDPYMIIKDLLYWIDNAPGIMPSARSSSTAVRSARTYIFEAEQGVGHVVMPQKAREDYGSPCPACGWEIVEVAVFNYKTKVAGQPIAICPYPIPTSPKILYTYTIDVNFMNDTPVYSNAKNGAWVRHDVICKKHYEDVEGPLRPLWQQCRDDYMASLVEEVDEFEELESILGNVKHDV